MLGVGCTKISGYVADHRAEVDLLRARLIAARDTVAAAKTVVDEPACKPPSPLTQENTLRFSYERIQGLDEANLSFDGVDSMFVEDRAVAVHWLWEHSATPPRGKDFPLKPEIRKEFDQVLSAKFLLVGRLNKYKYPETPIGIVEGWLFDLSTGKTLCQAHVEHTVKFDENKEGYTVLNVNRATGARSGTGVTYGGWAEGMRMGLREELMTTVVEQRWGLSLPHF